MEKSILCNTRTKLPRIDFSTFHLGLVHPLQDVALHQYFLSVAFLFEVVASFPVMSSCRLLLGCPLDPFPLLGCHSVQCLVHLLSFILAIIMSGPSPLLFLCVFYNASYPDLFLISEHGILSCSLRPNIFLSIAL